MYAKRYGREGTKNQEGHKSGHKPIFELCDVEIPSAIRDSDTKETEKGYRLYRDIPADEVFFLKSFGRF